MRLSVAEASRRLGIPAQAVRVLMQRGKLPIGEVAENEGRCTYYIISERLERYMKGGGHED